MPTNSRRILVALLFTLTLAGCGSAMGNAMEAFDDGRYPDAVGEFRALESRSRQWAPKKRTRYQLYRGLTHLSCGDLREATFWIGSAKSTWDRDPEVLDDKDRGRMLAAWRSMGMMPGEATP